jgi:hypothetical protein
MAAPSGPPLGASTDKTKKEFTPEQKRTFGLLGFAGVLALITGAIYLPGMLGGSEPDTADIAQIPVPTPATGESPAAPSPGGISPPGQEEAAGGASAPPASTVPVNYAPVSKWRADPFTPFIVNPLPPVDTPDSTSYEVPPVDIPQPQELAPIIIDSPTGASSENQPRLNLPSVDIPRMTTIVKAPRDISPPPRGSGTDSGGDPQPSYDKRLSGVVVANGVRALLEISSGGELKSYVVQPGDTVEGITVLNIQRFTEGTTTTTRMLIRENGQERYVDLKPAPQRPDAGLAGGIPGAP